MIAGKSHRTYNAGGLFQIVSPDVDVGQRCVGLHGVCKRAQSCTADVVVRHHQTATVLITVSHRSPSHDSSLLPQCHLYIFPSTKNACMKQITQCYVHKLLALREP